MKLGLIYSLLAAKQYIVFFTHMLFLALTPFGVYLTTSEGSFNPVITPAQHIRFLCTLVSCLLKVQFSQKYATVFIIKVFM